MNPETLPEELRREPAGGYGEDVDEVRPVVVAPVEALPSDAPPAAVVDVPVFADVLGPSPDVLPDAALGVGANGAGVAMESSVGDSTPSATPGTLAATSGATTATGDSGAPASPLPGGDAGAAGVDCPDTDALLLGGDVVPGVSLP